MKPRKALENFRKYDYPKSTRKDYLRLDFGENMLGCSKKVIERIRRISNEDISIYPEYDVRKKLAAYLNVKEEKILLTSGSDDALRLIFEAYLEKNDGIILMEPSFAMFEFYANLREAKIKKILLDDDLSFPKQRFLDAIDENTKLVVLCNPNNPTGTIIERKTIVKIIEKAKGLVLVDEAYFEFFGESVIDLIDRYENLVITRTFSKNAGLAGLRIGCCIANEKIIANITKISSPFAVNSVACIALETALDDWDFVNKYINEIKKSKKYLYDELSELGIKTYSTGANFFIANFGKDVKKICKLLEKKGILIRDRSNYPLLKGCARITIGALEQSKYFIGELKKVLDIINLDNLLFDMDGVLVDVSKSYRIAIKDTARFFSKKDISFEEIQSYKEKGGLNNDWELTRAVLLDFGKDIPIDKIRQKFDSLYLGGLIDNEKLTPDMNVLKKISEKYKIAIITGRPRRDADYTIKKLGLDKFFKVIMTMDDDDNDKTKGIRKSMKILNSKKAVYIGDTIDDMKSAKNAGIPSIGIIPPFSSEKTKMLLEKNGASIVFNSINEIEVLI